MKTLVLEGPGRARIVERPEPEPVAGQVLLKVEQVGLCGSDLNSYRGKNPMVSFPRVPGHEIAATVVGGATRLTPGTRVAVSPYTNCGVCPACLRGRPNACRDNQTFGVQRDGALAEYLLAQESRLYPSRLPLKSLCLVEPLTVGVHAVGRGRVTATDTVAIIGCGGVGLGAVAGAAFRGANTIAVDMDEEKIRTAMMVGAKHGVNTRTRNLHQALAELTDGRGPDVVIEAIGLPETFRAAVEEVAFTGRVVYIGYAKESVSYETRLFVQKELDILGSRNAQPEDFYEVMAMLEAERFPVEDAISHEVSLEDVSQLLEQWSTDPARVKKILVHIASA